MNKTAVCVTLLAGSLLAAGVEAQIFRRGNQGYQQPNRQSSQPSVRQPVPQALPQGVPTTSPSGQDQSVQKPAIASQTSQPQKHWSQMLTDHRDHDFGSVAKLSRQEHIFEFVNPLDTDLYVESASASCRCTIPTVLTPVVKPGETAQIKAVFDTRGFEGNRGATVRVRIRRNQPYHESAELLLSVKGLIRRDVVMDPGEFGFGYMKAGSSGTRTMVIKYAGNPQWQIQEARPSSDHLKVTLQETMRNPSRNRVDYTITVESGPELPKGDINEQIVLITNDANMPQLSVPVTGRIKVGIEAADIRLGNLEQGKPIERKLLVKGDTAFAIVGIQSSTPAIQFAPVDRAHRAVHMLSYRVDTAKTGSLSGTIQLRTTDPDQPELTLSVGADIVPSTFVKSAEEVASGGGSKQ